MLLERTRHIWKRKLQGAIFSASSMQGYLDEKDLHQLEDSMGFRGQWDEHRRFQIEQLRALGLKPAHSLMEVGCGPLTAGLPLIEYLDRGRYVGVDVRPSVLDLSWVQIGKAGLSGKNPRLICSDDFAEEELAGRTFDYIWAFSVLYHLADDILDTLFRVVAQRLAPDGRFCANVMVDMDSSTWLQFPFLRRTVAQYAEAAARHGLGTTDLGTIADLGFRLPGLERTNPLLEFRRAG
jgi:SAM-dependent methyltransferase